MRVGICASFSSLEDVAAVGFDFAEMTVSALAPEKDENEFTPIRKKILAAPVRVEAFNCFVPGRLKVTGPAVDLEAVRRHMEIALRRAGEVGAAIMVFGSGVARSLPEGFPVERGWSQLAEAARLAADIAARHGIMIAMEPLCRPGCNFFNRVDQGSAFVDRLNHPHLRLLADLFHVSKEQEPFADIAAAGKRLAHIHLATPAIPETGDGFAYDFKGFFGALRQAGYDGRVSVEDNAGLLVKKKPPMTEVYRAIRKYIMGFLQVKT